MKLVNLFLAFFKIGFFTIGGGYVMLPLIQKEVVDNNKWLSNEEFLDAIAVAQSSPGAVAVNISVYVGYNLGGFLGALVCTLGTVLPSVITILIVAIYLFKYRELAIVSKVFLGVRPAVVSLIAYSALMLGKGVGFGWDKLVFALTSFALIVFFDISPMIVIIGGALISVVYYAYMDKKEDKKKMELSEKEGEEL